MESSLLAPATLPPAVPAPEPAARPVESAAPILEHLAARAAQLYSMPAVAAEVLRLTGSGDVDRAALRACLENDPALTTRILKVVNSSLFGLSRKVTDLGQALSLLGVKPLKMLVLGFSIPSQLLETEKEVLHEYWRHTLLKAAACRELSRRLFPARAEESFTAGLLQGLGELVLIQQLGSSYIRFRRQVRREQRPLREAEWLALGFDHVELSARLLAQWGMPASFVSTIAAKEGADAGDDRDRVLATALQISEMMARVVQNGSGGTEALAMLAHHELGLPFEQVPDILQVLAQRAEELGKILSLDLPPVLDLSAAAHARLAETSADLVSESSEQALLAEVASLKAQIQAAARPDSTAEACDSLHSSSSPPRAGALSVQSPISFSTHSPLLDDVASAIARCRGQKRSLSLILFRAHLGVRLAGPDSYPAPQRLQAALMRWSQARSAGLALPQNSIAFLWEGWNRNEGFELARHMLRQAHDTSDEDFPPLLSGWMLSAGLATLALPTRNFPPQELIGAAERCLSGALLSGGGGVKSIEF